MKCEIYRYNGIDFKQWIEFLIIWETGQLLLYNNGEIEYQRRSPFRGKLGMPYWNKL